MVADMSRRPIDPRPTVAVVAELGSVYPTLAPFDPSEHFPELDMLAGGHPPLSTEANVVFRQVRDALKTLGLDSEHVGSSNWNPLQSLVPKDGLVVLKPNLVLESPASGYNSALTTHGSVVRAMITYVRLAAPTVDILVGDVPLQGADFDQVVRENGLRATIDCLQSRGDSRLQLHDLRRERALVDDTGFIREIVQLPGDPRGYVEVDVAKHSRLEGLAAAEFESFAVADYRPDSTTSAHGVGHHRYLIPASVLEADLIVNLPKLKTHQKAGLTVAIKNLVGINGDKARIPHFRVGRGGAAGDEYPPQYSRLWTLRSKMRSRLQGSSKILFFAARQVWRGVKRFVMPKPTASTSSAHAGASTLVSGGAWFGNDTLWRALHDLNLILLFSDRHGILTRSRQRRYLCVVDGVVAGEGDGPLNPIPRSDGVVLAGFDPLAVDLTAARWMSLDWTKIPTLAEAVRVGPPWTGVTSGDDAGVDVRTPNGTAMRPARRGFLPPPGWVGRVERGPENRRELAESSVSS